MDVRNCKKCGVLFQFEGSTICTKCRKEDEEDFDRIKEYLYEHPRASLIDVSNTLQISIEKVKRFLRDGRLEIINENNLLLECENCGKSIKSGRFCDECQRITLNGIRSAAKELSSNKSEKESKKSENGGFYFKGKDKK